ncbi:mediator of RNA polymerase II transcription subunit 10-like [Convolutriloba macropyga]|uniref:mediator of RNA polymerase II transcription subunit 10-like n=1 Tax=Convolutriloba macropyga TaxID=536237 RepID=UPI003F528405
MNSEDRFSKLEGNLEELIENIRQTCIMVSDFQPQGQNNLNQKMHSIVNSLQEVDRSKGAFQDVSVPVSVLRYIDQGTNPQLYSKDLMQKALAKNEEVRGKIEVYKKFYNTFSEEMSKTFPEVFDFYVKTRQAET